MTNRRDPLVIGLGEVLWDVFPDVAHFGGAPANFACHAAALGANVGMVSAVGNDELGHRVFGEFNARDVCTEYMKIDVEHVTGTVNVVLDDRGQANYEFASNTAWDYLSWNESLALLAARCDAVCFGTLAQRSTQSRDTIHRFLNATRGDCLRIFDVNLRQEFYDRESIEASLHVASVLKLNDDELPIMAELLGATRSSWSDTLRWLRDQYSLSVIALTMGANGSVLYADDRFDEQPPSEVVVVDTVGAGDAFTAALAVGLLRQDSIASIHRTAAAIAAFVCTRSGATPNLKNFLRGN